jgi:TetR/AcrR family transcriptional regulator
MNRRPRDADATRREILDAAERLFADRGFGSTSLAQIAKASNTHKSLILHHFDSKDGLWQAVKERRFTGFTREQQAIFSRSEVSLDQIRETTRAYFELLRDDPVLVQLLTRAELEKDLSCSQYDERRLAPFVDRIRAAQRAGLLRSDVPAAHMLLIIINVITQWFEARAVFRDWSELEGGDPDEGFLESLEKVFLEGARAHPEQEVTA